jgi:hypothetical protein
VSELEKIAEVMRMVQEDCEADAMSIDSKPFDAKTVGMQFGNLLAEVKAVARAVELLAEASNQERRPDA